MEFGKAKKREDIAQIMDGKRQGEGVARCSLLWKHLESYWLLPNLCLDRVNNSEVSSGIYVFATQDLIGILMYCRRYSKICSLD